MARIRVGLYHVVVVNDPPKTVKEVLAAVGKLPNDGSRARLLSENEPMRPRSLDLKADHCSGEFTRIQLIQELPLSNSAGKESTLKFGPDDPTPCAHTPFLFDYESNVLHIEEHSGGMTHAAFARYIQAVGELNGVAAKPVMSLDALLKFEKQKTFSRITVSLAGMDNASHLKNLGFNQQQIMALTDFLSAPKLKLEAKIVSRKKEPTGLNRVRETVAALLMLPPKNLKKLVVEGREEEDTSDFPVDLIKGRIKYEQVVNLEQGGIASDAQRHAAVRKAWVRHRDELRKRYSPNPAQ